jgi:hypothetical protein
MVNDMTKKQIQFNAKKYLTTIPTLITKILTKEKVKQLTEKQALDLVKLRWWDNPTLTMDQILVLQLYMIRQILPISTFVDGIGMELQKPVSIESIQTYRYTLLEYYRRKFQGEI